MKLNGYREQFCKVRKTMFLHSLQPLLACLQEVSDLCLLNPTTNSTLLEWQEVAGKERGCLSGPTHS